jgi:hypothetical protein
MLPIILTRNHQPVCWPARSAWIALLLFTLHTCPGGRLARAAQAPKSAESGVFVIMADQQRVGVEKFRIAFTASGIEAAGDLDIQSPDGGKVSETCILKLDTNFRPLSYQRDQKSPKKGTIAVEFGAKQSRLVSKTDKGSGEELFFFPESLAVLDTNFFHHYALLLREYKPEQAGPQQFNVFVPQEATPGTIVLELQGKESQTIGKNTLELNHFQASTEQIKIDIWAAPDGQIYRMAIPQAKLEIVRQ